MAHRAPKEPRPRRHIPWALAAGGVVLAIITAGLIAAVLLLGR